jgi:multidrug efflux pump subunit AcrA (membrane-fusion protein)
MKPKALFLALIAAISLQIACSGKKAEKAALSDHPVPVKTLSVRYEAVQSIVEAPGTIRARNRVSLSAQINGFVRDVRVRVGDIVKQDQVLALLDARDAQSQKAAAQGAIDEAQAALAEARKAHQAAVEMQTAAKASADLAGQTYARYQKLAESKSVTPQELDEVRTRLNAGNAELASREAMVSAANERIRQAKAKIAQAKAGAGRADVMLSWTEIKAPAAGRVVQRIVDPGTAIFPGTPLLTLESIDQPQVIADIPTEHSSLLRVGATVKLRDSQKGTIAEGRISEIVSVSNPETHSMQFKVDLPNNIPLPNGHFVTVEVPSGNRDALLVPLAAVRQSGQLIGIFVVDSASKAHFRLMKIASYDAGHVEVLSGIKPGEKIIAQLTDQIVDGIPVAER